MTFFHKKTDVSTEDVDKLLAIFGRLHTDSVWSKVSRDDFTTERFEAGYVNDICACILTEEARARFEGDCSPNGIVVKLFPDTPVVPMNVVHRGIVCSMVSDSRLGPKLIYVDEQCAVNEYIIGSRHYSREDDDDREFVKSVLRQLARYHCMPVPISVTYREGWLDRFAHFLKNFPGSQQVWDGTYLEYMSADDSLRALRHEFETMDFEYLLYLSEAQHELECPLVFCHMDFHRHNRLVLEKHLPDGQKSKEFYFVDLDSSLYFYRGADFGAFFDSLYQPEPYYRRDDFAPDDDILELLEVYRAECARLLGSQYLADERNDVRRMLREVKFFVVNYSAAMCFFAAAMYAQCPTDPTNVQMISATAKRVALFKKLRARFTDEAIMPDMKKCRSRNGSPSIQ